MTRILAAQPLLLADPDIASQDRASIICDARLHVRADRVLAGLARTATDLPGVALVAGTAAGGVYVHFTPEGARQLAMRLLCQADRADELARPTIAAMIAGKGAR